MNEKTIHILFAILRSVFHSNQMSEADKILITDDSLLEVVKLASKHDIAHLISLGVLNNGLADNEIKPQLEQIVFRTVFRYEKLNYELKQVSEAFEKAGIPFIPLKGSVLRNYYPEPWMRTSCDIDILVHENDLRTAITYLVENLKYTEHEQNSHDVSLFSPGGTHIELHYKLVEDGLADELTKILLKIWDVATLKSDWLYYYEMPDDMFYFYHIAHMAKHFENGGCGIRPLIDLWILDNLNFSDKEKRILLLQQGKLICFTEKAQKLSRVWLDADESDEVTDKMQNYILSGGVYGTLQNKIVVKQQQKGGKIKYALSKVILPYYSLKHHYPIIQKYPWLTPFMQVRRWFKLIFCGHAKRSLKELSYNNNVSKSEADEMKTFLEEIGL